MKKLFRSCKFSTKTNSSFAIKRVGFFRRATVSKAFYFASYSDVSLKLISRFIVRHAFEPALIVARASLVVLLLAARCYTKVFVSIKKSLRRVFMVSLAWITRLKTENLAVHHYLRSFPVFPWSRPGSIKLLHSLTPAGVPFPLIKPLVVVGINDGDLPLGERDFTVQWGWGHGRSSRTIRLARCLQHLTPLLYLSLLPLASISQAPVGVCLSNVAQTISNGVIAPIPYATVALCTPGSTASNCIANEVSIYTSTALSTATPTNPFTADAGGNYFFCALVGHYGLLINSSYGQYFVPDVTLDDDWSKGGTMTGALTDAAGFIGPLTGNVTGNASTASASDHSPTQCGSGLYSQGDSTTWAANCAQVNWGQIGSIPSFYYQTVQEAGSALTQQPVLNFDSTMAATNGSGKTNVGLPSTGTAGTYANPTSITTDTQGRVTGVSAGTGISRTCAGTYPSFSCYKVDNDGMIFEVGANPITTTSQTAQTLYISFPYSFHAIPSITVSGGDYPDGSNDAYSVYFTGASVNGFTAVIRCATNIGGSGCPSLSNALPVHWHAIGY